MPIPEFTNKARERAGAVCRDGNSSSSLSSNSLSLPFSLQGQKWKIRVVEPLAPHKPEEGSQREKKSGGHSPLGCSGKCKL